MTNGSQEERNHVAILCSAKLAALAGTVVTSDHQAIITGLIRTACFSFVESNDVSANFKIMQKIGEIKVVITKKGRVIRKPDRR